MGARVGRVFGLLLLGVSLGSAGCHDVEVVSRPDDAGVDGVSSPPDDAPSPLDLKPAADEPPAEPEARRVFVTSTAYAGDLGGLEGADAHCHLAASAAGLSGTWRAWIGTSATSPQVRLQHGALPYVRLDGVVVADDWTDLTDGTLAAPIAVDETGALVPATGSIVWTASDATGAPMGGMCSDWSEQNSGGFYGDASGADATWAHIACQPCTMQARLYCFEELDPTEE